MHWVGGRQRNWRSALVDHTKETLLISASAAESWWEYGHLVILYQQLETRSRRLFWLFHILNIELCSMQISERTAEMGDSIDVIYPALFLPIIHFMSHFVFGFPPTIVGSALCSLDTYTETSLHTWIQSNTDIWHMRTSTYHVWNGHVHMADLIKKPIDSLFEMM